MDYLQRGMQTTYSMNYLHDLLTASNLLTPRTAYSMVYILHKQLTPSTYSTNCSHLLIQRTTYIYLLNELLTSST